MKNPNALSIRVLEENDLPFFNQTRNQVSRFLHDSRIFTLEETISRYRESPGNYWLLLLGTTSCGYFRSRQVTANHWQIGLDLHPDFQNRGIGFESYLYFAQSVLLPNRVSKVSLRVLRTNLRAIALYEKLNFQVVGETEFDIEMETATLQLLSQIV